jgi:mono/diheme cytochrome c family protein
MRTSRGIIKRRVIGEMNHFLLRLAMITAPLALGAAGAFAADDAAALYKAKCQVCHGADGKGSAAGQKLGVRDFHSSEVAKMTDQELFDITKKGKEKMPGYDKKLTDDQIKSLVKYIRSLK